MKMKRIIKPCVYKLLNRGEVVYIGQTINNIYSRISEHTRTKNFDEIEVHECKALEMNQKESKLILQYKPKHNRRLEEPETVNLLTRNNVKELIPHLDIRVIKRRIMEKGGEITIVGTMTYYPRDIVLQISQEIG